ncbi:SusC/RagA family TonB-linked outer membrane protein [Seonamhaeicola maritimus]|uniref:SusC/RagA family TonB-linked outer membrane protein n=1 Tax=Seonamhaeicola maritimus TaxID=2591822 RepID=UPI0024942401|nr:TonB-dependent receptor [Seonamhaeicola maritimus]
MRTFIFLLCATVFGFTPVNIMSQNAKVKITEDKTMTVDQVFDIIKQQTDYRFIYKSDMFKNYPKVEVKKGTVKANRLLEKSLAKGDFKFNISASNTITIKKAEDVQELEISGTVTDENGVPLPGITVYVSSREPGAGRIESDFITRGTATDIDGKFTIKGEVGYYLAAGGLGYEYFQAQITGNQTTFNIVLKERASALDEVVVVGYGSTVRKDLTGSVGSLNSEQVSQVKSQTVDQALVGQVSGVFVESNAGAPGSGASVNIRGLSQINGDNQPLYVVDGIPIVANVNFGTFNGAGNRENPLLAIDPNNIERVDVLKDASSAAIYGSRAANGVILITTKKGKKDQAPQFSFSANATILKPTNKIDYLSTGQYKTFATEQAQIILDGLPPRFQPAFTVPFAIVNDPDNYFGSENTDWQDKVLNNSALWNQYNFSVSGGSSKTSYFVSASINEQDGLLIGNKFKRYNFNANIDSQIKKNIKIGASINYTYGDNKQSGVTTLGQADFRPDLGVYDSDGNPTSVVSNNGFRGRVTRNPLEDDAKITDNAISQNVLANVYAELDLITDLKFRSQISLSLTNDKSSVFSPSFTSRAINSGNNSGVVGATLDNQTTDGYTTTFTNTLNYNTTINEDHRIDAVAGVSWDRLYLNVETQNYAGFPDDTRLTNIKSANNVTGYDSNTTESGLNSLFGRVNYNYKDRYIVTLTARSDGSVKFGPNNQRGFFPSAGLGWNVHNEDFFNEESFISQLKLRASLGRTGSDNLPAFSYLPYYNALGQGSFYNGVNGIAVSNLPNPSVKWESTDQLDLGLEFGLFDGRLNGEVVYFEKNTSDLILFTPVPSETGFQDFNSNVADVSNKGWEFTLGADVIRTGDFRWNSSLNMTFVKNNVEKLNGGTNNNSGFGNPLAGIKEGEPIGYINGFEVVGIAQTPEQINDLNALSGGVYYSGLRAPGDYIFKDQNQDNVIDEKDYVNLGDINPDYYGGWNNTLSYKNFDLAFNFQFVHGNSRDWAIPARFSASRIDLSVNHPIQILDTWSESNTEATYARIGSSTHRPTGVATSRDVKDGSYIRLRFLGFGYNLPQDIIGKVGLSNVRLSLSANNLFTITDYPGQDPENVAVAQGGSSISRTNDLGFSYPQAKTFTFGLDLRF